MYAFNKNINLDQLKKDMDNIRKFLSDSQTIMDYRHINKFYYISKISTLIGIITLWLPFYTVVPWLCLSIGIFSNWTIVGHHVCHGGFDYMKHPTFNRKSFAQGLYRRIIDWFDWWLTQSWNIEHNNLHHYKLGEVSDPDLVEENLRSLREMNLPFWIKKIMVVILASTWKWTYYAPNTYKHYCLHQLQKNNQLDSIPLKIRHKSFSIITYLFYSRPWMNGLFRVMIPYMMIYFVLIPLVYGYFGYFKSSLFNIILAEILTNLHSFVVVAPNHCGSDLYRFTTSVKPRSGEFYLRQIISSTNYTAGNDWIDFFHGWLNYQIEHHLFPDLTLLSYRKAMPLVKEICKKHQIPYIQESVWIRLQKTVDIMIGKTNMRVF